MISNCIYCILHKTKDTKVGHFLNTIPRAGIPLTTYHFDRIGPITSRNKTYQYFIFRFCKVQIFSASQPNISTWNHSKINGTEKASYNNIRWRYWVQIQKFWWLLHEQGIEHAKIALRMPERNGEIERFYRINILNLAELSKDNNTKWK